MVKIKVKSLFLGIIMFILVLSVAHAAGSKLEFTDIDVKVGGRTSNNVNNGEIISDEAEPGDHVELRIKVQNNFTSSENLKINDIVVKATVEGIEDGDDFEDESNEFDLSPGSDKRVTIKFDVPVEVDEDTFDIIINAQGEDKNGTDHEVEMRIFLEVNKKSHQLLIARNTLNPAEVSCSRKNVQLATTVINIGSDDEQDISIQVSSPDLGIDTTDLVDELTAEPNEPESKFSKIYNFKVPEDLEAGSYSILVKALYNDDRNRVEDTQTLTVSDCLKKEVSKQSASTTSTDSSGVELITPPPSTTRTTAPVAEPVPAGAYVTQESFFKSNTFVAGIIIAEVIAVLVGIALVVSLFRRR